MRTKRTVALTAATTLGLSLAFAAPAGAGDAQPPSPILVEPNSGPVGTVITISGGDCTTTEDINLVINVFFVDAFGTGGNEQGTVLADDDFGPNEDGNWEGTLEVPNTAPGDYIISADCVEDTSDEPIFDHPYATATFEVTGDSTPTTAPPTTEPGETPPPPATPIEEPPHPTG